MTRPGTILILLCLLGWSGFWAIDRLDMFADAPRLKQLFLAAGLALTAVTTVMLLGGFLLGVVAGAIFQHSPSGLTRAVVHACLTMAASVLLLAWYGVNIGTILTTSAILGAVVGLAMQPTLGSVISGLSISTEPALAIGATIEFDGKYMVIEAKHWRHFILRRYDDALVMIPNSVLANAPITILPEDRATRFDFFLDLPPDVPPQKVTDVLADAFADMDHVDATKPVAVAPIEMRADIGSIRYRLRLFLRNYDDIGFMSGEIQRRAWYALNRVGIVQPRHLFYDYPPWKGTSTEEAIETSSPGLPDALRTAAIRHGRQYRFAPGEILRLPDTEEGRSLLILEGRASAADGAFLNPVEHGLSAAPYLPKLAVQKLAGTAQVRRIADRLAQEVGPVAEQLVRGMVKKSRDHTDLAERLADRIPDAERRARFLEEFSGDEKPMSRRGPGAIAELCRDSTGRLVTDPELRAVTEVLLVTFPRDVRLMKAAE